MSGSLNFAALAPIGSSSRAEQGLLAVTHQDGWENSAEGAVVIDPTMQAIQTSLDGLAARQRIIAQNLANSETPGYLAQNVNFEDSLSAAMAAGNPSQAAITTSTSTDPTNQNGNNVNVDTETVALMDTGLRYQLATQSMNNEFNILRDSIRQDL